MFGLHMIFIILRLLSSKLRCSYINVIKFVNTWRLGLDHPTRKECWFDFNVNLIKFYNEIKLDKILTKYLKKVNYISLIRRADETM